MRIFPIVIAALATAYGLSAHPELAEEVKRLPDEVARAISNLSEPDEEPEESIVIAAAIDDAQPEAVESAPPPVAAAPAPTASEMERSLYADDDAAPGEPEPASVEDALYVDVPEPAIEAPTPVESPPTPPVAIEPLATEQVTVLMRRLGEVSRIAAKSRTMSHEENQE